MSLDKLLHQVALGQVSEDLVSTLAARLARIDSRITPTDRTQLEAVAGQSLKSIGLGLVEAIDPDRQLAAAQAASGPSKPTESDLDRARAVMFTEAVRPIAANPELREQLINVQRTYRPGHRRDQHRPDHPSGVRRRRPRPAPP